MKCHRKMEKYEESLNDARCVRAMIDNKEVTKQEQLK